MGEGDDSTHQSELLQPLMQRSQQFPGLSWTSSPQIPVPGHAVYQYLFLAMQYTNTCLSGSASVCMCMCACVCAGLEVFMWVSLWCLIVVLPTNLVVGSSAFFCVLKSLPNQPILELDRSDLLREASQRHFVCARTVRKP